MRRHFHRCANLRVVSVPAQELHGARRGGGVVLDELCEAKHLAPCVGLAECDILTIGQKQDLLAGPATRMREEEGRPTELSGVTRSRAREIRALREEFVRERDAILEEELRRKAEIAGSEALELVARASEAGELGEAGLSIEPAPAWAESRIERLEQLAGALETMRARTYGTCALCGREIAIERLRLHPETRVCAPCAGEEPEPRGLSVMREGSDRLR